jgi:hypothetical protein
MWNFMQLEIVPEDRLIKPMTGPGELTREQARAEVQALLDRSAGELGGQFVQLAARWRAGVKDDTVFLGPFTWTIYEYKGGGWREGAMEWLKDYAATIRAAGINVQTPRLP